MKNQITKKDVLFMLLEIEKELDYLEESLEESLNNLKRDILEHHEKKLEECDKRLTRIERSYERNLHNKIYVS